MGEPVTDKNDGTVAATDVTVPEPLAVELIVWFGHEPVMVTFVPATNAGVAVPLPPLATGSNPVTPVVKGRPVAFVNVADVGVPRTGVTSVGEVDNTTLPVPVVLYEVSQAEPVDRGMPAPGYTIPPPPPPDELIVWLGQVPVMDTLVPATKDGVAVPLPPFATGNKPITPVVRGKPVKLVAVPLEGVPNAPPVEYLPLNVFQSVDVK